MHHTNPPSDDHRPQWPTEQPRPSRGGGLGDDLGAGLAEYALLLLLIAVACIGALTAIAPSISAVYNQVTALL